MAKKTAKKTAKKSELVSVTITDANANPVRVSVGGLRTELWVGTEMKVSPDVVAALENSAGIAFTSKKV